jgi:two-component system sensor histidine kinase EvgS
MDFRRTLTNAKGMAGNVVLIADDHKDSADSLRDRVVHFGHQAHVAYDGHAALSLGAAKCPDIALLDIHMPGMDGFSVARSLRAACGPGAVLVAITGAGVAEAEAYRAGFDIYLAKPADPAILERILFDPLGAAAAQRARRR